MDGPLCLQFFQSSFSSSHTDGFSWGINSALPPGPDIVDLREPGKRKKGKNELHPRPEAGPGGGPGRVGGQGTHPSHSSLRAPGLGLLLRDGAWWMIMAGGGGYLLDPSSQRYWVPGDHSSTWPEAESPCWAAIRVEQGQLNFGGSVACHKEPGSGVA